MSIEVFQQVFMKGFDTVPAHATTQSELNPSLGMVTTMRALFRVTWLIISRMSAMARVTHVGGAETVPDSLLTAESALPQDIHGAMLVAGCPLTTIINQLLAVLTD